MDDAAAVCGLQTTVAAVLTFKLFFTGAKLCQHGSSDVVPAVLALGIETRKLNLRRSVRHVKMADVLRLTHDGAGALFLDVERQGFEGGNGRRQSRRVVFALAALPSEPGGLALALAKATHALPPGIENPKGAAAFGRSAAGRT